MGDAPFYYMVSFEEQEELWIDIIITNIQIII